MQKVDISSLPEEVVVHIFSHLPPSDLSSVGRTCTRWSGLLATRIQLLWSRPGYWPSKEEVHCAAELVTEGYLSEDVMTTLTTRIQSSWTRYNQDDDSDLWPDAAEVHCAATLVTSGYLAEDVMKTLATKSQSLWDEEDLAYWQCAAALATSGYMPDDVMATLATRIQPSVSNESYWPSDAEVRCADVLVTSGFLPEDLMTELATRIQESWSYDDDYGDDCSAGDVRCAAALAATGHLTSVDYLMLDGMELPSTVDKWTCPVWPGWSEKGCGWIA